MNATGEPKQVRVSLWHGTTEPISRRIVKEGLIALPTPRSSMEALAAEYDVDADQVAALLKERGRFIDVQDARFDHVWCAASEAAARRWAERAPEYRWEVLWMVWLLRTGRSSDPDYVPWMDPEAAAWHLTQRWSARPAVVRLLAPQDAIPDHCAGITGLRGDGQRHPGDGPAEISLATPVPSDYVVGVEVFDRRVEFTEAAGLLAVSIDELVARVKAAELPEPEPPEKPLDDAWWPLSVFSALTGIGPSSGDAAPSPRC